jgi:hypothetical protein
VYEVRVGRSEIDQAWLRALLERVTGPHGFRGSMQRRR